MSYRIGPDLMEYDEAEPTPALCPHCGYDLEWIDCDQCGGEGEYDAYEDDPMWFDPGDTEPCAQCGGDGGWTWCDNQKCPAKQEGAPNA